MIIITSYEQTRHTLRFSTLQRLGEISLSQNQDLGPPETVRWPILAVGSESEAPKKGSTEVRESIEVRKAKSKERLLVKT